MKILLINPSLLSSKVGHYKEEVERNRGIYPPLGICYVSSVLKKLGHIVNIIDIDATEQHEFTDEYILELNPNIVGIYLMTWTFHSARDIVKRIRKLIPSCICIAGGPNCVMFPKETLEIGGFDYVVQGESENILADFIDSIYSRENRVIEGNVINDLDSLDIPDRSWIDYSRYFDVFTKNRYFATMMTSRGCPYSCTYCDRKNRMGKVWRQHSPKRIIDEIKCIKSQGISEIMFFDDEFIIDKSRIYELCELIKENSLNIDWECRARVDQVDLKLLQAMKSSGCYRIRYGFESGDQETLNRLKKGITLSQSMECSKITKKAGIEVFGYFMMGCPEETKESVRKTLEFAFKIDPHFMILSQAIMIPGSELFDWGVQNGQIDKNYWIDYLSGEHCNGNPTINTKDLSSEYVSSQISKANKMFYFRPSFIRNQIRSIRNINQLKRKLDMARSIL